jgi:starvation-inducible DNA-binding protein
MKIKSGMTDAARKSIAQALSHFLADSYAIYLKTQNFHWNVKGPHFFALHFLFEKQYSELSEALDEIAERIQALGFHVDASFASFQKECCIKDDRKPMPARKMVERLLSSHEELIRCAREIATIAEEGNDQATVDLMARRLGTHEKMAWMLRSHL